MHAFQKVSQSSLLIGEIRFYSGKFFVASDMIEPVSLFRHCCRCLLTIVQTGTYHDGFNFVIWRRYAAIMRTKTMISYQCCDHTCNLWHLGPVMVMLRMMMVLMMIMMMAHKRDSNSDVKSCNSSLLTSPASLSVTRRTSKMAMARSEMCTLSSWGPQCGIRILS